MKKMCVVLVIMVMLFPGIVLGQTWHTANQATLSWNVVDKLVGGVPIPTGDVIKYTVYLSNPVTDPNKTNPAEIATTTNLEQLITLNVEGKFLCGVRTERWVDGEKVSESEIGWSDNPLVVQDGDTFGIRYFLAPMMVDGMHP